MVQNWHIRDVSARTSKAWPLKLKDIIVDTQGFDGVLAAASVDRLLRTPRDWIMVQESEIKVLICDDANLDTSTPSGKRGTERPRAISPPS